MNEMFTQLFKEVFDSVSQLGDLDGFDIKTEKTPNGISITVKQKPEDKELLKFIEDFQKYVKDSDDFIFEGAVDTFNDVSDIKVNDLQKLINEKKDKERIMKYCECFKDCIKAEARDFVDEIKEKYGL